MQDDTNDTKAKDVINDNELSLPQWFHEECSRKDIFESPRALSFLLNGVRQDVFSALSLYQVHVKYATTLVISLMTVVGVMFSISEVTKGNSDVIRMVEVGAGILTLVACVISLLSSFVITRYYNVYVSALLYGAQIHFAAGMAGAHWFKRTIDLLHKKYKKKPDISRANFISNRTWSWNDSHFWYVAFLFILSGVCALTTILMWFVAPLSS